jgi:hypothetical protein
LFEVGVGGPQTANEAGEAAKFVRLTISLHHELARLAKNYLSISSIIYGI